MTACFFERPYPSANAILLPGPRPVLVDPGAGSDVAALRRWLQAQRAWPSLVVNTHWHTDHAGGNHALQAEGVPVAAPAGEQAAVNGRDRDACRSWWLGQQIESYTVGRGLVPGEVIDGAGAGGAAWRVVALPGHTAAQIGLFCEEGRVLVSGDALHAADLGWLDLDADPAALEQAEATIEAIAALDVTLLLPGHGPATTDVGAALRLARRRSASWRAAPERIGWHSCKRIFTHMLMVDGGLDRAVVADRLAAKPWFQDHARRAFGLPAPDFAALLVAEMLRSGAAAWDGDVLTARGVHAPVPAGWPEGPGWPAEWPSA